MSPAPAIEGQRRQRGKGDRGARATEGQGRQRGEGRSAIGRRNLCRAKRRCMSPAPAIEGQRRQRGKGKEKDNFSSGNKPKVTDVQRFWSVRVLLVYHSAFFYEGKVSIPPRCMKGAVLRSYLPRGRAEALSCDKKRALLLPRRDTPPNHTKFSPCQPNIKGIYRNFRFYRQICKIYL